jgi:hypothetical protein
VPPFLALRAAYKGAGGRASGSPGIAATLGPQSLDGPELGARSAVSFTDGQARRPGAPADTGGASPDGGSSRGLQILANFFW